MNVMIGTERIIAKFRVSSVNESGEKLTEIVMEKSWVWKIHTSRRIFINLRGLVS